MTWQLCAGNRCFFPMIAEFSSEWKPFCSLNATRSQFATQFFNIRNGYSNVFLLIRRFSYMHSKQLLALNAKLLIKLPWNICLCLAHKVSEKGKTRKTRGGRRFAGKQCVQRNRSFVVCVTDFRPILFEIDLVGRKWNRILFESRTHLSANAWNLNLMFHFRLRVFLIIIESPWRSVFTSL